MYQYGEKEIKVTVRRYNSEDALERFSLEKQEGQQDTKYTKDGVVHSIAQNNAACTASWTNGLNMASIMGGYGVWATAKSDGVVRIHADVEAVRTSDEVGVSYITVQESRDGGDTWTTLETFTKEDLGMYDEDTPAYYGTFDFEDTVIGRDYRALVGVYAERNGGGDLRSVYTNEVTAKR